MNVREGVARAVFIVGNLGDTVVVEDIIIALDIDNAEVIGVEGAETTYGLSTLIIDRLEPGEIKTYIVASQT